MSVESAKAFLNRVFSDEEFAKKLMALDSDEARKQFAEDAGYDFNLSDMEELLPAGVTIEQIRSLDTEGELPDELMEAIVGGKSDTEEFFVELTIEIVVTCAVSAI